jgi:hypothetical protein
MYVQGAAAKRTPLEASVYHKRNMPAEWAEKATARQARLEAAGMEPDAAFMLAVDETMIIRLITEETAAAAVRNEWAGPSITDAEAERDRAVMDLMYRDPAVVYTSWKFGDYAA